RLDRRVADDGLEILGMRFTGDRLCPPERFDELERRYGDRFLRIDIDSSPGNPWGYPLWAHSVLTVHYDDAPDTPTRRAWETMLTFLRRRLNDNDEPKGTTA
ncbi:MAG: dienelactone hydrolase, partial [Candidatus Dadabacteria bacterium]